MRIWRAIASRRAGWTKSFGIVAPSGRTPRARYVAQIPDTPASVRTFCSRPPLPRPGCKIGTAAHPGQDRVVVFTLIPRIAVQVLLPASVETASFVHSAGSTM